MKRDTIYTLTNRQNGNLAFNLFTFSDNSHFNHLQRNNFYSLIWIKKGKGILRVDASEYAFQANSLFSFTPYQAFLFSGNENISGVAIQYHSDFYCIHENPLETNCDTVIFNNIYQAPFTNVDKESETKLNQIIEQMERELQDSESNDNRLLIPYLKIFLVTASRIKIDNTALQSKLADTNITIVLHKLQSYIEASFIEKHSPSAYAEMLNITPNALSKIVKTHFNKTLTELIVERIIIQAKSELYMTNNSVKEIAWKLGYSDEFYFSRLFKKNTGVSPKIYRETVGFGKAHGLH